MLVDTHSHLHFAKFDEDRQAVHARMAEFDVKNITVGTAITTSRDAIAYADSHSDTWCSVGYHPEHVTSDYEDEDEKGALSEPYDIKVLEELATSSPRVLAIGECGLDYHRLTPSLSPPCQGENVTGLPFIPYQEGLSDLSKDLRKNQTPAEKLIWKELLSNKKSEGYKFTRQKPLDGYIADFYCSELLLVIEIDGGIHQIQKEQDEIRTLDLGGFIIQVIRYTNDQVLKNLDFVKVDLRKKILTRKKELQKIALEPGVKSPHDKGDLGGYAKAKASQQLVFGQQIELAAKLDKALIVHMRDAEEDMLTMIKNARTNHPNLCITMHSFTSTWKQAQALLDLDCYIGIGGIVTFKPRKTTAEDDQLANIAKNIPLDRLLIETDCPWLAPVPVRGERNEPTHVRHIAEFIANLRGLSFEEISKITTENAQECFKCEFK
ncbi:MAG: TatD family hydrolase [Patescibacteria group bacterium]|nr:TatD family hydrolase [Patescibacteria group bacterium]